MSQPVIVVPCSDYEQDHVAESVSHALDLLGGMDRFVQPGQHVLIKVNLLSASAPERAITTHPAVVEAVVRAVQAAGGTAQIGDSPGSSVRFNEKSLLSLYHVTGMSEVAARTGAQLMLDTRSAEVSFPEGKLLKRIEVIQAAIDADVIISIPKLKNHILTAFTGATKNMFGIVPGTRKALLHATPRSLSNFVDALLDILQWSSPALTIMDGVVGMEGNGPSAGQPKAVGVILASRDGVALDAIAAEIVGLPLESIPLLRQAAARGWWTGQTEDIPVLGSPLDEVRVPDFIPARSNHHPESGVGVPLIDRYIVPRLVNALAVRPTPQGDRCTGCRSCVRACPRDAIVIRDGLARIDYGLCIRCYCCHEMCPEKAIELEQPRLSRLLRL